MHLNDETHSPIARGWRFDACHAALAFFVIAYISFFPFSVVHQDFARDMFIGLRLADGISFPMQGPILAATVHMGPAWYCLLGLLFKLCRNWMFVTFCIALLGSLQFPLAYALGKEIGGKFVGIVWASLLLIPSWSSFEQVLPLHYQLTATLVLALLFHAQKFRTTDSVHHAFAMVFFMALVLHAHPTTICFVFVVIPLLTGAFLAKRIRAMELLAAFAIASLLFVPYAIFQAQNGFADFRAAANYLSDGQQIGSWRNLWPLLTSVTVRGTYYWLSEFVAWNAALAAVIATILIVVQIAGWGMLLFRLGDPSKRTRLLQILYTVAVVCIVTALIRSGTPFYMTTPLHVVLLGAAAVGLGEIRSDSMRRWLSRSLVLSSLILAIFSSFSFAQIQMRGTLPVAFIPIYDVIETGAPPERMPLLPAYGIAGIGRFLCNDRAPSIHGALSRQLLYDYAMEMRLQCGRSDVVIGGNDMNRDHWIGLSQAAFSALGLSPYAEAGSMGIVKAFPLGNLQSAEIPQTPVYPAWMPTTGDAREQTIDAVLPAGASRIAISNRAFFVPAPSIQINSIDKNITKIYQDNFATIFQIQSDRLETTVEIKITSTDPNDIDVVAF